MKHFATLVLCLCSIAMNAPAQTSAFTFQGRLNDSGVPANGTYDFQFWLFDTLADGTGTQLGTQSAPGVQVTNGVFSVTVDFGPEAFSGGNRFIQVVVRPTFADPSVIPTILSPRQPLTSTPYAVRSLSAANADQLAGVAADQYVMTGDVRLSDARTPIPGSPDYIQNSTSTQPTSNFAISGTGKADTFDAASQFSISGNRVLGNLGTNNFFAGQGAGSANSTGSNNAFFGANSGQANDVGSSNSFFGSAAGTSNANGNFNAFFGTSSGRANIDGNNNAFFGFTSGRNNSSGFNNSFFGNAAGFNTTLGGNNTFTGFFAGSNNTTGQQNTFFGASTGATNTIGGFNTLLGYGSDVGSSNLSNATAIGAYAAVARSNSLVLGSINGVNNATADTNVGIGTTSPTFKLHIVDPLFSGLRVQTNSPGGSVASFGSNGSFLIDSASVAGGRFAVSENGTVVVGLNGTTTPSARFNVFGDGLFTGNLTVNGSLNANISLSTVNATQYDLGGSQIIGGNGDPSVGNFFAGFRSGQLLTNGTDNSFFGIEAGKLTDSGGRNSFFGYQAGLQNTAGHDNSYFGYNAGLRCNGSGNSFFGQGTGLGSGATPPNDCTGSNNSFFGQNAGTSLTNGQNNAAVGQGAGSGLTTGSFNSFLGAGAGAGTIEGSNNTFIGQSTGGFNRSGTDNTAVGSNAWIGSSPALNNLTNATAIGANSCVTASNSLVLGGITNCGNPNGRDTKVGIGTSAPSATLHVVGDGLFTGNLTVNGTITGGITGNFIQNTTTQQAASNFNISGDGTAGGTLSGNVVNATAQFNIAGTRVLTNDINANVLLGFSTGGFITTGSQNTFIGLQSGSQNDAGGRNTFLGFQSGQVNTTGTSNTAIGRRADFASSNLDFATAIGANATVSESNSLVLGSISGVGGCTASINCTDTNVGIGTTAPSARLHVVGDALFTGNLTVNGMISGTLPIGSPNYIQNGTTQQVSTNFNISGTGVVGGNMGVGNDSPDHKLDVLDISNTGLRVQTNSSGGTVASFGPNGAFQIDKGVGNPGGRFTVLENGNVGINNATPSEKLDVAGNIKFSGTISGNGSGLTNVSASNAASTQTTQDLVLLGSLRWDLLNTQSTFSVGNNPQGVAFDGANIWVANNTDNSITKLKASDGALLGTFSVGHGPQSVAFDGVNIWVSNSQGNTVSKLRASDGAVQGTFTVGNNPQGVAFDGANIWVANQSDNNITKLRASDGTNLGTFAAGTQPIGVAFDGNNIFVTAYNPSEQVGSVIHKLRASDGASLGTLPAIVEPYGIAFDGSSIWFANFGSNNVARESAADGSHGIALDVGTAPKGVAFDGTNIWVTNSGSNTVSKIRTSDGTVLVTFGVGLSPSGIAFDGRYIWVVNSGSNTITKIPAFPF